jgi:hypothetical protein
MGRLHNFGGFNAFIFSNGGGGSNNFRNGNVRSDIAGLE